MSKTGGFQVLQEYRVGGDGIFYKIQQFRNEISVSGRREEGADIVASTYWVIGSAFTPQDPKYLLPPAVHKINEFRDGKRVRWQDLSGNTILEVLAQEILPESQVVLDPMSRLPQNGSIFYAREGHVSEDLLKLLE